MVQKKNENNTIAQLSFGATFAIKLVKNMPNHRSLSLILGFDVAVGIVPRKIVFCRNFILHAVATFWVCCLSEFTLAGPLHYITINPS